MNRYTLNTGSTYATSASWRTLTAKFVPILKDQKINLLLSFAAVLLNTGLNLAIPIILGLTIDRYIGTKQFGGVLRNGAILLVMYLCSMGVSYFQTKTMGTVGQMTLFKLRDAVFAKLQHLPLSFFNQNKSGDLISRINNDTDNLNQFFSQAMMRFAGNLFMMAGSAVAVLAVNPRLGAVALAPAVVVLTLTRIISVWMKRKNTANLQSVGVMSAEIQESLENFKVVVVSNRRDYFRSRFSGVNDRTYHTALTAGITNRILAPVYLLASASAQLLVLLYGIHLVSTGQLAVGLLISYFSYLSRVYDPLREIAELLSTIQLAVASWDRISEILSMESDLVTTGAPAAGDDDALVTFDHVGFRYDDGHDVLTDVCLSFERGKTYALVGPTGGGKTTTASLMARLYDPTSGTIRFSGRDLKSYTDAERTDRIGFIIQEPILFTGTLRDNIVYGNDALRHIDDEGLTRILAASGCDGILTRFPGGLATPLSAESDGVSLGQRQLVAFIRAVIRKPDLIILDEATANIDTVTERMLGEILDRLPPSTTKVVIAHRLNTIEHADEIYFVNSGRITRAGSMENAVSMLLTQRRAS